MVVVASDAAYAQQEPWKGTAEVGANILYGASRSRLAHVTFYQPAIDQLSIYVIDSNTSLAVAIDTRVPNGDVAGAIRQ
jgi:hypothetical protein